MILRRGERNGLGRRGKRTKKIGRREKGSKNQGDGRTSIKREDGEYDM